MFQVKMTSRKGELSKIPLSIGDLYQNRGRISTNRRRKSMRNEQSESIGPTEMDQIKTARLFSSAKLMQRSPKEWTTEHLSKKPPHPTLDSMTLIPCWNSVASPKCSAKSSITRSSGAQNPVKWRLRLRMMFLVMVSLPFKVAVWTGPMMMGVSASTATAYSEATCNAARQGTKWVNECKAWSMVKCDKEKKDCEQICTLDTNQCLAESKTVRDACHGAPTSTWQRIDYNEAVAKISVCAIWKTEMISSSTQTSILVPMVVLVLVQLGLLIS